MLKRFAVLLAASAPLAACATASGPKVNVDLAPARQAVANAREAGAPERASATFTKAQGHLNEAEAMNTANSGNACQADSLVRLAVAEAQCAVELSRVVDPLAAAAVAASNADLEKLQMRLRKAEEDQHRLEDKVGVLQRDLEMTETEVIRTKARLKGNETKAEASSAIAEARILIRRIADTKGRAASVVRCQELLAKAEQLLKEENFGAAAFFALKAQDTAVKATEDPAAAASGAASSVADVPAPQKHYSVRAEVANIRRGPGTTEPIVATAPKGSGLDASLMRGDWIKVSFGGVIGWVHRSLLD
jgi:hypothetical protein